MEQIHASHQCEKKQYTIYNPDWAKLSEFEWVRETLFIILDLIIIGLKRFELLILEIRNSRYFNNPG